MALPLAPDAPAATRLDPSEGETLLAHAHAKGLDLPSGCRVGTCGACAVEVIAGLESVEPPDFLESETRTRYGFTERQRLACRARARGDGAVLVRPLDP